MVKFLSADFEEGVRLSYEHAIQLLESAELLLAQDKDNSSKFLALHAREELGRAFFILDDIKRSSPWVSENRWEKKLTKHGPKRRRYHKAVNEALGYKESEVTITLGLPAAPTKFIPDGDVIRRFAEYDQEERDRSLYVDYGVVRGGRQWISPINPLPSDARSNIGHTWLGCQILKTEAEKLGILLQEAHP